MKFLVRAAFTLIALFILLIPQAAEAVIRLYEVSINGKTYYVITLEPRRIRYARVGDWILGPSQQEFGLNILGTEDERSELRIFEKLLSGSQTFQLVVSKRNKERLLSSNRSDDIIATLEQITRETIQHWTIEQYRNRNRFPNADFESRYVRSTLSRVDGTGYVVVLDEQLKIIANLGFSGRTQMEPNLQIEDRVGNVIQPPRQRSTRTYLYSNSGEITYLDGDSYPGLVIELGSFVVSRKASEGAAVLMPMLARFAEESGMAWRGPLSRSAFIEWRERRIVTAKYVMSADMAAATVYSKKPYQFSIVHSDPFDTVLEIDRRGFLKLVEVGNQLIGDNVFRIGSDPMPKTGEDVFAVRLRKHALENPHVIRFGSSGRCGAIFAF